MNVKLARDPIREGYWYARSSRERDTYYLLQVRPDGQRAVCNCIGFTTHNHCKHQRELEFRMTNGIVKYSDQAPARAVSHDDDEEDNRQLAPVAVRPPKRLLPSMQELDVIARLAKNLSSARGFAVPKGVDHPAKAFAIIYAGYEVGIGPMTAMRHVYVVNGQTSFSAQLMMGLVQARDPSVRFVFHRRDAQGCVVELFRRDESLGKVEYLEADAKRAKALEKTGPWKEHPDLMYAYAAIKRAVKLFVPDLALAIESNAGPMADAMVDDAMEQAAASVTLADDWAALPQAREDVDADTGELRDVTPDERPWTADELRTALKGAGLSASDLAIELGVGRLTEKTVAPAVDAWLRDHPGDDIYALVDVAAVHFRQEVGEAKALPFEPMEEAPADDNPPFE